MENWEVRSRPIRLERRFEFDRYEETRDFLDRLGELSESLKRFPDISFGVKYVNLTLRPDSEDEDVELSENDYKFAAQIDELLQ